MSVSSTLTSPTHRQVGRVLGSKNTRHAKWRKMGEEWTLKALAVRSIPNVNAQGCWEWTGGSVSPHGVPRPTVNLSDYDRRRGLGRHPDATRVTVAFLICQLRGSDMTLPGYQAQHSCDNGWCVNPDHIVWGPRKQNDEDRMRRPEGWISVIHRMSVPQLRTVYWLYCSTLFLKDIRDRVGLASNDSIPKIGRLEQKKIATYFAGDGPPQNSDLA